MSTGLGLFHWLISSTYNLLGIKKIYELKVQHAKADEILNLVCENLRQLNEVKKKMFEKALISVSEKEAEIFNLLCGFRFKNGVASIADDETSNTLLQVAALLAPSSYPDCISGAALQMQREMHWFKVVESVVDHGDRLLLNKEGLRSLEYFQRNHKELRADGEKWVKKTASSYSVVGALIVTIMFAVAIMVPGGNNQNLGDPHVVLYR
ncbi:uncharacterized protein LOC114717910 [Neltuma alba]|uniref:uncharacterized protein LOC114717910 n=1 Tax=Neltuma alba TaxID=207710 RepID=UPI0010A3023C|nr:uncharacterized protein LOC114717910 [Prosopis alba]